MAKDFTKKMKGFADDYLETGNGTQSALNNYDIKGKNPRKTASVIAVENLAKPSVMDYLERNAIGAVSRIVELSELAENESVKLNANKDILDRAGYRPVEKTESLSLNIESRNSANPELEAIRKEFIKKLKDNLA